MNLRLKRNKKKKVRKKNLKKCSKQLQKFRGVIEATSAIKYSDNSLKKERKSFSFTDKYTIINQDLKVNKSYNLSHL